MTVRVLFMNYRDTLRINGIGHLEIGGVDTADIAEKYGTPVYVLDEAHIRNMCRVFKNTLNEYGQNEVLFASKALSCKGIYELVLSEGLGADVVSGGELYTARRAGFPPSKIYFHGNNKSPKEIDEAVACGVGVIVIDCLDEIEIIEETAEKYKKMQNVAIRLNNGIEAHTHSYMQTARVDCKFGLSLRGGDALKAFLKIREMKRLNFTGVSCHIGSQILETEPFIKSVEGILDFYKTLKNKYNFDCAELNLGGGFGVWYTDMDGKKTPADYASLAASICTAVSDGVRTRALVKPKLILEPGRSIVAEAGITLYGVGNVKEIRGVKKYVNIDGGMFDNPRHMLYQAKYSAIIANKAAEKPSEIVTVAGKCCESGDIIASDIWLASVRRGDLLCVFSTGAYNYSMASHYNRNLVPPVVIANEGKTRYLVKPETYEDLIRNDA
jgi:diaminopimelate decarboxylase